MNLKARGIAFFIAVLALLPGAALADDYCTKAGEYSDPTPFSPHLFVHYAVSGGECYQKEPNFSRDTVSVQKLTEDRTEPVFRLTAKYKYADSGWQALKAQLRQQSAEADYSEVAPDAVPLFSPGLKKQLQPGDVVRLAHCMEQDTCYFFTDRDKIYFYMKYDFVPVSESVYIDYQ